jgi:hypothetical protein
MIFLINLEKLAYTRIAASSPLWVKLWENLPQGLDYFYKGAGTGADLISL